ncbi:helix-turn-helix transcriptional regulator [uncultured Roseicyclus sp.]|jgi:predicted transcriptional regulator/transcriptional regulator with XRE-family HTH domain|uniref:helix-turn-helix transcriptional regulator n=1 Tax=uncultured Roseicyclus sp. TaxID=543072 RepID=UPI0026315B44|nr:helix-turn-helix transcriptional regulator [uncultured Roseicyclus sp.]
MAPISPFARRAQLTGNRIRERRLVLGLKQAALADAVGISASYLNLIEHNRRRIGGKLLLALARALMVEPAQLSEGADATLYDALQSAARDQPAGYGAVPETDRIDEMAGRFPGWVALIAEQQKRIAALEALVEGLRDRIGHDPVLAESMHEVLSTVAAIRSTADILVREPDLDAVWRGRFHRNLHEEAERLSTRATALIRHFEPEAAGASERGASTPIESVEAMFEASDHHFPEIEVHGQAAIATVLARTPGMEDPATRALGERWLLAYAADAARLPLPVMRPAAEAARYDPAILLGLGQGDVALVLRRLATLPRHEGLGDGPPAYGLAVCDGSGALIFRRRLTAFSIPRFGAGCPLWPLYRALGRPGQPEAALIEMPQGALFRAWAVSQPAGQTGFGEAPVMQAVMLVTPVPAGPASAPRPSAIAAGPGCHLCARTGCPARR